ncbi:MAG: glucose/arabinose dehydrogenase [Saprospiraceae bacterium]|jgi:glucose/arabinose dehydrogenase
MKTFLTMLGVAIFSTMSFGQQTYQLDSTTLTSRTVRGGLDIPWEITWGPDNFIWMTERKGLVSRVDPVSGVRGIILDLTGTVYQNSESGLLGLALHPDFSNSPFVYIVYTYFENSNILERMVRYEYNGSILQNPSILIDGIQGNTTHIGSRLHVLPDNTLLMSTGDAQMQTLPQNVQSLSGKILRFNLDGTVPSDNPIPGSYVYSWGHRNAQGIWSAPNGNVYIAEHGPNTDDELQLLLKGRNYGWPTVAGFCDLSNETQFCADSNVVEPLANWTPTIAPSDIIWYDHPAIPEFNGKLLLTVLKNKELIAFDFNPAGDQVTKETHYLGQQLGRLRDICISPEGKIYLATNGTSWSNTSPDTHTIIELENKAYVPTSSGVVNLSDNNVNVWPNPSLQNGTIHFDVKGNSKQALSIFDSVGKQVYSGEILGSSSLKLGLSSGIYLWKSQSSDGTRNVGRLIIK